MPSNKRQRAEKAVAEPADDSMSGSDEEEEEVDDGDDSADYMPEETRVSKQCKSGSVVHVTDAAIDALRAVIGATSGSQYTAEELTERARDSAQHKANAIGSALQGNVEGVAVSTGKMMNAMGGGERYYDTAAGLLSVNTNVKTKKPNLMTSPGIAFTTPLKSGMNVFSLVKSHKDSEVSGFTSAEAPGEILNDGGALLLMCEIPGNGKRLFSPHSISSTGVFKQLNKDGHPPFNTLVSVQAFLYTKELRDHQIDPKKAIQNGDSRAASGSLEGARGVHACMGNLRNEYVVPFHPAKDADKQLKGIMNVIDPYCTIDTIRKESRKLCSPECPDTIGFRQFSEFTTKLVYARMNKNDPVKNPFFMGIVIQPLCALNVSGKEGSRKLDLSFSVFGKSSNGSVQSKFIEVGLNCSLAGFLKFSIGDPEYLREDYKKHGEWILASKFEDGLRKFTETSAEKVTQSMFIVKPGSKLYPHSGTGKSTRTDTNNSIHNVLPQIREMSLEEEAMNMQELSKNANIPAPMQNALLQASVVFVESSKFTSLEYKPFLESIFKKNTIEFSPLMYSLEKILEMLDEETAKEPSNAMLTDFFSFKEVDPVDVEVSRNIFNLTYRALLFSVHCNSAVSLHMLVREYHYFDKKLLEDSDYTKVHEAKEQRYAELLESASFFGCTLWHCRTLMHDLIDEINKSTPKKRDHLDKNRMDCLSDFNTTTDVSRIVGSAMEKLNVPKKFDARHIGTYSDKDAFMKYACVMHRFVNSPEGVSMQTIIEEANKEGGQIDAMKAELRGYLKELIQATYKAIPEEEGDGFDFASDSDEDGGDDNAEEAASAVGAAPAAADTTDADAAAAAAALGLLAAAAATAAAAAAD